MKIVDLSMKTILGILVLAVALLGPVKGVIAQEKEEELMPMELNGTTWSIDMTHINKKGKKIMSQDTLVFKDKLFSSESYQKKGHEPTNYSLTVDSNGATNFGTMTTYDGERYFWNGQVFDDNTVSGSLSILDEKGNTAEYYFKGKLLSGDLKRQVKPEPGKDAAGSAAEMPPADESAGNPK